MSASCITNERQHECYIQGIGSLIIIQILLMVEFLELPIVFKLYD